jgi:hypothetical protein
LLAAGERLAGYDRSEHDPFHLPEPRPLAQEARLTDREGIDDGLPRIRREGFFPKYIRNSVEAAVDLRGQSHQGERE